MSLCQIYKTKQANGILTQNKLVEDEKLIENVTNAPELTSYPVLRGRNNNETQHSRRPTACGHSNVVKYVPC